MFALRVYGTQVQLMTPHLFIHLVIWGLWWKLKVNDTKWEGEYAQNNLSAKYLYIKRPKCKINLHNLLRRYRFPNNENSIIYLPKPIWLYFTAWETKGEIITGHEKYLLFSCYYFEWEVKLLWMGTEALKLQKARKSIVKTEKKQSIVLWIKTYISVCISHKHIAWLQRTWHIVHKSYGLGVFVWSFWKLSSHHSLLLWK